MKIVLIGAYGYTGQLIAKELRDARIQFDSAGSDLIKLKEFHAALNLTGAYIQLDILNLSEVQSVIQDYSVIINCAGPFTEQSDLLLHALMLYKNKIYLDICGESEFVRNSFDSFNLRAIKQSNTIIHACAFESALVDLVVSYSRQAGFNAIELNSFYQFKHSKPSPGTRLTMKLSKYRDYKFLSKGVWLPVQQVSTKNKIQINESLFAAKSYPLPELVFFDHTVQNGSAASYLLVTPEEALFLQTDSKLLSSAKEELDNLKKRSYKGPTETERNEQKYAVFVQLKDAQNESRVYALEGCDMYGTTAKIMCEVVQKIMHGKIECGLLTPAVLFRNQEQKILQRVGAHFSPVPSFVIHE